MKNLAIEIKNTVTAIIILAAGSTLIQLLPIVFG